MAEGQTSKGFFDRWAKPSVTTSYRISSCLSRSQPKWLDSVWLVGCPTVTFNFSCWQADCVYIFWWLSHSARWLRLWCIWPDSCRAVHNSLTHRLTSIPRLAPVQQQEIRRFCGEKKVRSILVGSHRVKWKPNRLEFVVFYSVGLLIIIGAVSLPLLQSCSLQTISNNSHKSYR